MQRIYCPWREAYFGSKGDECVFCEISKSPNDDEKHRVFYRDEMCFAVMNLFPYTPGHFMIIPHTHCDSPESLDPKIWQHIHSLSQKAFTILYEYGASGVNMGMNIKRAGGAGIPEHLHLHFVPRFIGDTNFITTIGDTRTYGNDFDCVYRKIKAIAKEVFKDR